MHTHTIVHTTQPADDAVENLRFLFPHVKLLDIAGAVPYLATYTGDECAAFLRGAHTDIVVQEAFLYRHGNQRIDTYRKCFWDSGKIGEIVIDPREWKDLKGYKNMSPKRRKELFLEARDIIALWQDHVEAIMNGWLYDIICEDDEDFECAAYGATEAEIIKEIKYLKAQGHQLVDKTGFFRHEVKS